MEAARAFGGAVKLIASAKITGRGVLAMVAPTVVRGGHPFTTVNGVFNAILVKGNVIDQVMFYGRGAGKFPTASAVVADVVDAVRHLNQNVMQFWSSDKYPVLPVGSMVSQKLVRICTAEPEAAKHAVAEIFGETRFFETTDGLAFATPPDSIQQTDEKIARLGDNPVLEVMSALMIMEEESGV